jgi:hypothetical protein
MQRDGKKCENCKKYNSAAKHEQSSHIFQCTEIEKERREKLVEKLRTSRDSCKFKLVIDEISVDLCGKFISFLMNNYVVVAKLHVLNNFS